MGTWDSSLFADLACDVRDHYVELLERGVTDKEATRLTLTHFRGWDVSAPNQEE